jgi:hypothetical protein
MLGAAGCSGETILRLTVQSGDPMPSALLVTLAGDGINATPRRFAVSALPGVLVIRGLPDTTPRVCVDVQGLDAADLPKTEAAVTVDLVPHGTARATLTLLPPSADSGCSTMTDGGEDLAAPPADLAAGDLASANCPLGALFCDDFELDNLSRWDKLNIKYDAGSQLAIQTARAAHGTFALEAIGTGTSGAQNFVAVEKDFPAGLAPPLAVRANIFAAQTLDHFTLVMVLSDNSTHGFSMGGDTNATWVITEDEAVQPDRHSDMVPTDSGKWHCLEIVVDAAGNVTGYVDNHALIGPFPRASAVNYTQVIVGITRTATPSPPTDIFVDDVAVGPARLYCP